MKTMLRGWCVLFLVFCSNSFAAEPSAALDLRKAVPVEAHMAVYGRHNAERDYQQAYLKDIWNTAKEEKIVERVVKLVTAQVPEKELEGAKSVFEEVKTAVEPVDWESICRASEAVYVQQMEVPVNHHLLLMRLTPEAAADCEQGAKNLFALIQQRSEGKLTTHTEPQGAAEITTLRFPEKVPFHPAVARIDDVLLISSSEGLLRHSLAMLQGSGDPSKFDDPRLAEALRQLPEPEDSLVFFDGRQMFSQLRGIGQFIRDESHGDPKAARVAGLMEKVFGELSALDYTVTAEYTDGARNCSTTLIKMMPSADGDLVSDVFESGEPFADWQRRVPADAVAYSLNTGANLHALYEHVVQFLREDVPESVEKLDALEKCQEELGIHLDRDVLQAFSGECVSITLPSADPSDQQESLLALRCHNPDRIRELLHRLVDKLQEFPAVKAQQLEWKECEQLEGFEELSASMLAMFNARPVIGFHDGWMVIGSSANAAQKVLDTWDGTGATIDQSPDFQRFGLDVEGPVRALSYSNLAENTRQAARNLNKAGAIAPMFVALIASKAEPKQLETINEALKLVPSVAKIVGKFDYLEAKLQVVQSGDAPDTYVQRCVTLVRPPGETRPEADLQSAGKGG